jgi:peptidoglycan/LPS O-acetylase OafA/YrhL
VWLAPGKALAIASVAIDRGLVDARPIRVLAANPGWCWLAAVVPFAILTARQPAGGLLGIVASLNSSQSALASMVTIALTVLMAFLLLVPAVFDIAGGGRLRAALGAGPIAFFGLVSYAFYLWHLPIVELLGFESMPQMSASGLGIAQHVQFATTAVLLILSLAVTLLVATASYRLIELPFLRLKER